MLKEPVYDPRYPLVSGIYNEFDEESADKTQNASTATGHEANRSGVEPNTMEEVGTMVRKLFEGLFSPTNRG